jgi:hypothetical protein
MKMNKFLAVLIIFALVFSLGLVGCGDSEEKPSAPEAPTSYTASDPANQPKIDMIFPNLTAKVKDGVITQERMNEILKKVGDGEMSIEELQKIMNP